LARDGLFHETAYVEGNLTFEHEEELFFVGVSV
jgi:hypothetical protein